MEKPSITARLRFLKSAAHLYSASAPSTSAHLMLQHAEQAATLRDTRSEKGGGSVCTACGMILVPGWTSRMTLGDTLSSSQPATRSKTKKRKLTKKVKCAGSKYLTTECLVCRRYTKQLLQPNADQSTSHAKKTETKQSSLVRAAASTMSPGGPQQPATQNLSSKQRAKTRKQGGLQAMLEISRAANQSLSESGLGLVDLMKKT